MVFGTNFGVAVNGIVSAAKAEWALVAASGKLGWFQSILRWFGLPHTYTVSYKFQYAPTGAVSVTGGVSKDESHVELQGQAASLPDHPQV